MEKMKEETEEEMKEEMDEEDEEKTEEERTRRWSRCWRSRRRRRRREEEEGRVGVDSLKRGVLGSHLLPFFLVLCISYLCLDSRVRFLARRGEF